MSKKEKKEGLVDDDDLWTRLLGPSEAATTLILTGSFPDSSILKEAKYDKLGETLNIVFKNTSAYTYLKVPENIANGLFEQEKDGKSAGKYFTTKIKNLYSFVKTKNKKKAEGRSAGEKEGSVPESSDDILPNSSSDKD